MLGVGADGIDGAVVPLDLPHRGEVIHVPHLDHASSAGAQHHGAAGDESQGADPVFVRVGDLLHARGQSGGDDQHHLQPQKSLVRTA